MLLQMASLKLEASVKRARNQRAEGAQKLEPVVGRETRSVN